MFHALRHRSSERCGWPRNGKTNWDVSAVSLRCHRFPLKRTTSRPTARWRHWRSSDCVRPGRGRATVATHAEHVWSGSLAADYRVRSREIDRKNYSYERRGRSPRCQMSGWQDRPYTRRSFSISHVADVRCRCTAVRRGRDVPNVTGGMTVTDQTSVCNDITWPEVSHIWMACQLHVNVRSTPLPGTLR